MHLKGTVAQMLLLFSICTFTVCLLSAGRADALPRSSDKGDLQSLIDKLVNEDSSPSEARSLQPSSSDLQKYNWLLNKYGPYVQYGK
uniref:Pancreatic hormone n=1 Tax=Macrostomum lignano TaxID=282301 RepID=A0A1I8IZR1_9PLAT